MNMNPLFPDEDDLGDSYQQAVLMDDNDQTFAQDNDDDDDEIELKKELEDNF